MCTKLYQDSRLFQFIQKIDQDAVASCIGSRCQYCGDKLDRGFYHRKPRGVPELLEKEFSVRPSFCCRGDGCRRRLTPVQLKFLGRKVYVSVVVLLVAAMTQGLSPKRLCTISRETKVPPRTVKCWLAFWQLIFTKSPTWLYQRGMFQPPIDEDQLPLSLLQKFTENSDCSKAIEQSLRLAIT